MSYKKWFDAHALKHATIMEKLQDKSDDEVIEYFDFENMREKEFEFCPLYAKKIKKMPRYGKVKLLFMCMSKF